MPLTGRRRNRFSVRARSTTRDGLGVRALTYTHKFYYWAQLAPGPQALVGDAGGIRSEARYTLRGNYRPDLEVGDKFVDTATSREFYVEGLIDPSGRRRELRITVSERPNPGT